MKRLVSMVTLLTVVMSGCAKQPVSRSKQVVVAKKENLAEQQSYDMKIEDVLKEKGNFIEVRGVKENYNEGQNISFVVDTKGKMGYLYIMSVDNDSVTLLQPNPDSPLSQMRGKRTFPEDFTDGKFYIKAVKNCQSCQKEKTTLYALLTKKPIDGIKKKITGDTLLSFYKNSQQAKLFTKGIARVTIQNNDSANLSIGKADFFVE